MFISHSSSQSIQQAFLSNCDVYFANEQKIHTRDNWPLVFPIRSEKFPSTLLTVLENKGSISRKAAHTSYIWYRHQLYKVCWQICIPLV